MIIIGLTGSIGMGKSTVAKMFQERSIPVHDADATVHFLLGAGGKAVAAVAEKFPEAVQTDEKGKAFIDRPTLSHAVFVDRAKKAELENILHPLVRAESDAFITEMKNRKHDMCVLDIPLLFETGGEKRVDVTIVVSAPEDVQRSRVFARDNHITAEKFAAIVAGQMPDAEKRERADYIIENGGDLEETGKQLDTVIESIKEKSILSSLA